jgi:aspartate aminotransferase
MNISQLAKSIPESPTLRLTEEARLLKEKGEAVIHLGAGEPKNKAPINAILSSAAKLNTGDVKYTPADGSDILKRTTIKWLRLKISSSQQVQNNLCSTSCSLC